MCRSLIWPAGRSASALLLAMCVGGCAHPGGPQPPLAGRAPIHFDALVVHVPLEGGFYGLLTSDERRYEPLNLAPQFQKDGLRLRLRAELADVASVRMWGQPVRILHAERLFDN